jgi:hypothetical protein
MGILASQHFPDGTIIRLHVSSSTGIEVRFLAAEIRHSTSLSDGRWILGCKLLLPLTATEVSAFGR